MRLALRRRVMTARWRLVLCFAFAMAQTSADRSDCTDAIAALSLLLRRDRPSTGLGSRWRVSLFQAVAQARLSTATDPTTDLVKNRSPFVAALARAILAGAAFLGSDCTVDLVDAGPASCACAPLPTEGTWRLGEHNGAAIVIRSIILGLMLLFPAVAFAQNMPDPSKVAPEYRDLAEKRRAEVIRQVACNSEAAKEKVLRRDQAAYVNRCMEKAEKAQQAEVGAKAK